MKKTLLIGLIFSVLLVTAGLVLAEGSTQYLVNNSTIYKVETASLWTTSLNELLVITQHRVTSTTQIFLNDSPAQLQNLKPGFRVVVYYINDPYKTAAIIKAFTN